MVFFSYWVECSYFYFLKWLLSFDNKTSQKEGICHFRIRILMVQCVSLKDQNYFVRSIIIVNSSRYELHQVHVHTIINDIRDQTPVIKCR